VGKAGCDAGMEVGASQLIGSRVPATLRSAV
jgi:hypothetical protein